MVSKSKILGKSSLIFVTVGSTNFPFDRLFIAVDNALEKLHIEAKLVVQTGFSTYKWRYKNVELYKYLKPKEMEELFKKANRIIVHCGFGTLFSLSTKAQYMPLIIPRLNKYGEHINNHQQEFFFYFFKKINIYDAHLKLIDNIKKYLKEAILDVGTLKNIFPHDFIINKLFDFIDNQT